MSTPTFQQPMLFISDVHLGGFSSEEDERIESELIQLVNYCQRNNIRIAVLGDLFDYWMEYPDYVPQIGQKLVKRFSVFNKEMGGTLFITGNHDNWTGDYLKDHGFIIEHENVTFSLNGESIMVMHGDGLSDTKYDLPRPIMHRLLRNRHFINFYQNLFPPKAGITVMKYFSRLNRLISRNPNTKKLNRWARKELEQTNHDIIICGHDHVPRHKRFTFGTYINLGTFYKDHTMAFYNNERISLVTWRSQIQSLEPFDNNNIDE